MTILFIDSGLYVSVCRAIARHFERALYYSEYKHPLPSFRRFAIGSGYPEMERVENLFDAIEEADVIFSPDVYYGDLLQFLADNGKKVFGSMKGEEMELYRVSMKKHMQSLNLPVGKYRIIIGLENLRKYLQENNNKFIKSDVFRDDFETFEHVNYHRTEAWLDDLAVRLGALKSVYKFIVEDQIGNSETVEGGTDFITVDGKISNYLSVGYEIKSQMYAMEFKKPEEISELLTGFNQKIAPTLEGYGYKGMASTEIRIPEDKKPYMIDFCARIGSPPGEIWSESVTNWREIIENGVEGKLVPLKISHKYGVQLVITSEWVIDHELEVYYPAEIDQWVKLHNCYRLDGKNYVTPTKDSIVGYVVAIGDSIEECEKLAVERAKLIEAYDLEVKTDNGDNMHKIMKKGEQLGIKL